MKNTYEMCVFTLGSQFAQPESHLGQMDVNDLMAKLIDFGIIKPTQTDLSSGMILSIYLSI